MIDKDLKADLWYCRQSQLSTQLTETHWTIGHAATRASLASALELSTKDRNATPALHATPVDPATTTIQ